MDNKIKELIDISTKGGNISEEERNYIIKRASELGVDEMEVNIYINASLKNNNGNSPQPNIKPQEDHLISEFDGPWIKFKDFEIGNWILFISSIIVFISGFFPWVESHVSSSGFGESIGGGASVGGGIVYTLPLGVAAFVCAMKQQFSKYRLYMGILIIIAALGLVASYSSHSSSSYGGFSGSASTQAGPGVAFLFLSGLIYTIGAIILLDKNKRIISFLKSKNAQLAYLLLFIIIPMGFRYHYSIVEALFAAGFWVVLPYFLAKKEGYNRTKSVMMGNFAFWAVIIIMPEYIGSEGSTYIKYFKESFEIILKYYVVLYTVVALAALIQDYLETQNKKIDFIDNAKILFIPKALSAIILTSLVFLTLFSMITKHEITQEEWKTFINKNKQCEGSWYYLNEDSSDVNSMYINFEYHQDGNAGGIIIEYSVSLKQTNNIELKKSDPKTTLSVDYKYEPNYPIKMESVLDIVSVDGEILNGTIYDSKGREIKFKAYKESEQIRKIINERQERLQDAVNEQDKTALEEVGESINVPGKYPQGSQRTLTISDIQGLSKDELKIMRNEIFARHGFIFKTPEMKSHFEKESWYQPQFSDVNGQLTNIEEENINFIKKYE